MSIVIPVLRDTAELEALLADLTVDGVGSRAELVVANGDPLDASVERLSTRYPHVQWVATRPSRGRQMNAGRAAASGRWLLFLHADARLDPGWMSAIEQADRRSEIVGGAFRLVIDSPRPVARLIERGVAWRVRWLGLPYGDQAFFVRREAFDALGGYRPIPLMEDVELIHRLARHGRLLFSRVAVRVSARRWERDGWLRRTSSNIGLAVLYFIGVSPDRLAQRYYGRVDTVAVEEGARAMRDPASSDGRVWVIMPALDDEAAIADVLSDLPDVVTDIVVVDNGSSDATAERARVAGAIVVSEPSRGYGRACLAGLRAVPPGPADIVVFLDADRSDFPEEMHALVSPIRRGDADFVMGDRGAAARPWQATFGTRLCVRLINLLWGTRYRDLGPFRAIRRASLERLDMADQTWGWTIEMQVKAAEAGLAVREVPIRQRDRVGRSKISGTLVGALRAGSRMLHTIWSLWRTRGTREYRHG